MVFPRFLTCALLLGGFSSARATEDPEPQAEAAQRRMVVIDPGHGGKDMGAVSNKVAEKDLVLTISKRLGDEVSRWPGFASRLTRESDEFVPLSERVERARKAGAAVFVSIHADKAHKRGKEGVILYCFGKNRSIPKGPPRQPGEQILPPPPREQVVASRRLARCLEQAMRSEGLKVGEMDRGAFAVLKSPDIPSVLVEVGNLLDRGEAKGVAGDRFQQRLVRGIAQGLKSFFAEAGGYAAISSAKR